MANVRVPLNTEAYCTHGSHRAPKEGGKWLVSKNKLTRRWICAACYQLRKEHKGERE